MKSSVYRIGDEAIDLAGIIHVRPLVDLINHRTAGAPGVLERKVSGARITMGGMPSGVEVSLADEQAYEDLIAAWTQYRTMGATCSLSPSDDD